MNEQSQNNSYLGPSWLDLPISFFEYDQQRNTFATVPSQQTTLRRIATTGYYQKSTEAIRTESDKEKQDELKKRQPAFTPVALLRHRKRDTDFSEKLIQQWPLLMADADQKDNPDIDMAELKRHIARLPYVLLCAYSVRKGLWFIVRLPDYQSPESLAAHSRYLHRLFSEKFGIYLDSSKGGNPTDLRFVSFDREPYINERATVMTGTYHPIVHRSKTREHNYKSLDTRDEDRLLRRIVEKAERATDGQRHMELRNAAILAGGYVAGGQLDEQTVIYALETVASEWPTFSKSQKTIRDGIRYGQANPIHPEASNEDLVHYRNTRVADETTLLTAKPYISPLAVSRVNTSPENTSIYDSLPRNPDSILKVDESQIKFLSVEPCDEYPVEWDKPSPPNAVPTIKQQRAADYFAWQRQSPPFNRLGLGSLNNQL